MESNPTGGSRAGRTAVALDEDALARRFLAAKAIAVEAGHLALRLLADPASLDVQLKGPQDFVTAADRAVEKLIAERLAAAFPEDAFLGEEFGSSAKRPEAAALWVVDPIDGTSNFARARTEWCVSIGLIQDGRPDIGVIYHPPADELFAARRGLGAHRNGVPIRTSRRSRLREATVGFDYSSGTPPVQHVTQVQAMLERGGEYRRNGSAALSLAHVADGRLDGFVELHLNAWDVVAGMVLVSEAGGWTSDFLRGASPTKGSPLIAAAPGIRDELLTLAGLDDWR
jgi:myo-inositol-1(or 4)-monophosphatase